MKTVREIPTWAHGEEVHERVEDLAARFYYLYGRSEAIYGATPKSRKSQDKDVWRIRWINDIVTPGGLMYIKLVDAYSSGALGLGAKSRPESVFVVSNTTGPDRLGSLWVPSASRDRFMSAGQYLSKLHEAQIIGAHLLEAEVALGLASPPAPQHN